jgi:hypothetical protein
MPIIWLGIALSLIGLVAVFLGLMIFELKSVFFLGLGICTVGVWIILAMINQQALGYKNSILAWTFAFASVILPILVEISFLKEETPNWFRLIFVLLIVGINLIGKFIDSRISS